MKAKSVATDLHSREIISPFLFHVENENSTRPSWALSPGGHDTHFLDLIIFLRKSFSGSPTGWHCHDLFRDRFYREMQVRSPSPISDQRTDSSRPF